VQSIIYGLVYDGLTETPVAFVVAPPVAKSGEVHDVMPMESQVNFAVSPRAMLDGVAVSVTVAEGKTFTVAVLTASG
jgi:hypothetical protein